MIAFKDKALGVAAEGFEGTQQYQRPDSASTIAHAQAHHVSHSPTAATMLRKALDAKRLSTAAARCALNGITMRRIEADAGGHEFVCSKWSLTRRFASLDELEAWLERVDGRTASGEAAEAFARQVGAS